MDDKLGYAYSQCYCAVENHKLLMAVKFYKKVTTYCSMCLVPIKHVILVNILLKK